MEGTPYDLEVIQTHDLQKKSNIHLVFESNFTKAVAVFR